MFYIQIEWRCTEKGDGLRVFVDNVEVRVIIGNDNSHSYILYEIKTLFCLVFYVSYHNSKKAFQCSYNRVL